MIEQKVKKTRNPFKLIPWYGWVGAVIFIVFQIGLYKLGGFLSEKLVSPHWSVCPKIPVIDDAIPYCPYFFIQIYFLAYAFWFIAPLWISTGKKENFINFMIYGTIASFIGFIWFVLMPSVMNRTDHEVIINNLVVPAENLIEKAKSIKTPFTRFLVQAIIAMDTGDLGWNLCPSYHCMASALCAFGVMRIKQHHLGTRIGFEVMAVLVFLSTVFVKQHYFADILGGIGVAAIPYLLTRFVWHPGEKIMLNNPQFLQIKRLKKSNKKK
ncbi:MAG: phosphatase PAP2 family protein [Mycoplasma sp.]|nr:phosphatase PAP2 family protein [Candidatus Hennigella equi]